MRLGQIIPIHMRALERMRKQLQNCPSGFGPIGLNFMSSDPALKHLGLTSEEILQPLIDRRLVIAGDVLRMHCRISGFGLACLALGWMPLEAIAEAAVDAELVRELKIEAPNVQKRLPAPAAE